MAVGQGAEDLHRLGGRNQCLAFEDAPDHLDLVAAWLGDVGDGAGLDLAVVAIALADQLGRRRVVARVSRQRTCVHNNAINTVLRVPFLYLHANNMV